MRYRRQAPPPVAPPSAAPPPEAHPPTTTTMTRPITLMPASPTTRQSTEAPPSTTQTQQPITEPSSSSHPITIQTSRPITAVKSDPVAEAPYTVIKGYVTTTDEGGGPRKYIQVNYSGDIKTLPRVVLEQLQQDADLKNDLQLEYVQFEEFLEADGVKMETQQIDGQTYIMGDASQITTLVNMDPLETKRPSDEVLRLLPTTPIPPSNPPASAHPASAHPPSVPPTPPVQVVNPLPSQSPSPPRPRRRVQSAASATSTASATSMDSSTTDELIMRDEEEDEDEYKNPLSEEDLKPHQAMKRRSKKPIPDVKKDEKYWKRRMKNNMAARRSRELRREKENQITMRASFLEREHKLLKMEIEKARCQNSELRKRLSQYENVDDLPPV